MKTALFINFSNETFIGEWDKKKTTFIPGKQTFMPAWLAEHYAKHLTNRELIRNGNEVYCSPKKPEDVPQFMELFNKACILQEDEGDQNELESEVDSMNRNHGEVSSNLPESKGVQVIEVPDDEEDEEPVVVKTPALPPTTVPNASGRSSEEQAKIDARIAKAMATKAATKLAKATA